MKEVDIISQIKNILLDLIKSEYSVELKPEVIDLERPNNELWGDYASNVSLMLSKEVKQSPIDVAKKLSYGMTDLSPTFRLGDSERPMFEKVSFAAPGFINFTLSKEMLLYQALRPQDFYSSKSPKLTTGSFRGQKVLLEYTDPNLFKVFHIGHLMPNIIGESFSRLIEFNGAEVKRANYQGDVGMHVAKSIWGMFKKFKKENASPAGSPTDSLTDLESRPLHDRVEFLGEAYALGATAFEEDEEAQREIKLLNTQAYIAALELLIEQENWKPVVDYKKLLTEESPYSQQEVNEVYKKGREWSLEDFEILYDKLGTKFDYYFFESKVGEYGLNLVHEYIKKGTFEENEGAVIFRGEKYGLHTRVFINSRGLPLYEAKDLSLAFLKNELYAYDRSYIITGNEVDEYFEVGLKAMEEINPDLASKTTHIGHGMMKFKHGKMASRAGNVITGVTLLEDAKSAVLERMKFSDSNLSDDEKERIAEQVGIGAVKYSILKHGISKDIIYDKDQATSIIGDTGPYLQYTHARANSVLEKAGNWEAEGNYDGFDGFFEVAAHRIKEGLPQEKEVAVLKQLAHFTEVVQKAAEDLAPSAVCNYLFELAQRFNAFYNDITILNEKDEVYRTLRLYMTKQVRETIRVGLWLLGIQSPEKL